MSTDVLNTDKLASEQSELFVVCPVGILTVTHQGAGCDAPSRHFDPTIIGPTYLLHFAKERTKSTGN